MHSTATAPAVEAAGVRRTFGSVRAVDGVDLRIDRGEVVALLGPNGAGKTTFLDMVLGFTVPSSGTVATLGEEPVRAVRAGRASAVLQTGGLLDDLTVAETVRMIAACHLSPGAPAEVLRRAGLDRLAGQKVRKCSGGERQRLRFALALLTSPELIVLDEPTTGMDVRARSQFWETMHAEARSGRTVVFATHYLTEASDFADRIVLMRGGRVHADGTVAQLTAERSRILECTWAGTDGAGPEAFAEKHAVTLRPARAENGNSTGHGTPRVSFTAHDTDALAYALLRDGLARDLRITHASLDDVFLDLTEGEDRTEGEPA
jgi:ABC-2 type transport system ATP-binding protein